MAVLESCHEFSLCQRGNPLEGKILLGGGMVESNEFFSSSNRKSSQEKILVGGGGDHEDYLIDNDRNS